MDDPDKVRWLDNIQISNKFQISNFTSVSNDNYIRHTREKMKNITYGQLNEWLALSTCVQFVWIKRFRHIKYAVAHAQSYGRRRKQTTERCKIDLTKQLIFTWLSVINTNVHMD